MPVDDQGQRSFAKDASSANGPGQEFRNSGQRDLATETDAHLTRNVSRVASVIISQRDRVKFQIFCRWFSFGGEVLRILETWILDAQNHVANCGRLDPWQGLVEPRKGIAKAPAEAPKKEVPTEVRASPLVPATWRSTRDPPKTQRV